MDFAWMKFGRKGEEIKTPDAMGTEWIHNLTRRKTRPASIGNVKRLTCLAWAAYYPRRRNSDGVIPVTALN